MSETRDGLCLDCGTSLTVDEWQFGDGVCNRCARIASEDEQDDEPAFDVPLPDDATPDQEGWIP